MTQIVILAGGMGTRIYPYTKKLPKSLIKVNNKPFILYQLEELKKNNIFDLVICLGYKSEKIVELLGDGSKLGFRIKYSFEESSNLLGTLGALIKASDLLDENFFLMYGDSFLEVDFHNVYENFVTSNKFAMMTVYKNNNQFIDSNIKMENNLILEYGKLNSKKYVYVDYGLFVFKKSVLDFFKSNMSLDLNELIQKLISLKQIGGYIVQNKFFEIGSFQGIKDLEKYLKEKSISD